MPPERSPSGSRWRPRCAPTDKALPQLQIFNAGPTPWGTRYLVYGPDNSSDCLHATEGDWRGGVTTKGQTQWITGPVAVDRAIADGTAHDVGLGTYTIQGRVVPSVVEVEITYASASMTVPVVNGTFMAAVRFPAREIGFDRSALRALDANGRVVDDSTGNADPTPIDTRCWVTPDGTILGNSSPVRPRKCEPAIRWR